MSVMTYVLWSADRCLYVGCTGDLPQRLAAHARNQRWWPDVARVEAVGHADLVAARLAEARLIAAHDPEHNIIRGFVAPASTTPVMATDVLSVEQAAAALGLTPRAIRHRIKAGTLAATKLGPGTAAYVISRAEIDAALKEGAA